MRQVIDHGDSPGDGEGEVLYYAFEKCNLNFEDLYAGGERDAAGNLVYPQVYQGLQTVVRNTDGSLDYTEITLGLITYRLTYAYDSEERVSTVTATNGTSTWIKTFTYSVTSGLVESVSAWVLQ